MKGYKALKSSKQKNSAYQLIWVLLGGLIAILAAYFAEFHLTAEEAPLPEQPAARILINELMSRNDTALPDDTGAYSDWLEIINEEIPAIAELERIYDMVKLPKMPEEFGISNELLPLTFKASKDIRDKYVLSRLAWDLGILDEVI